MMHAFQQAAVSMLQDGTHPYFWAAFALYGLPDLATIPSPAD
jgi:CHAT domain-containing protein